MSSVDPRNHPRNDLGQDATARSDGDLVVRMPPASTGLLVAAGVCLLIPIVALMWVSSYAKETPRLGGIPFFFWYQFAWVFVTSALTYTAHRLVLAARGQSGAPFSGHAGADDDGPPNQPIGDGDRLNPTQGYPS
jgi:hypothetical protein